MKDAQILEVTYWYEGLADWAALVDSVELPVNIPMTIAVHSRNSGDEAFSLRTNLKVTDPHGDTFTASPDVYYVPLEPEEDTWIYFDYITFTGIGVYGVLIEDTEYGETAVLDSLTVSANLSTVPEDTMGSIMPMVGLVMAMGVMGMMITQAVEETK